MTETGTAVVDGRSFLSALAAAASHADTSGDIPELEHIRIRAAGSRLRVHAFNRITAGIALVQVIETDGDIWECALRADDAKDVIRLFRLRKNQQSKLRVTAHDGQVTIADTSDNVDRELSVTDRSDQRGLPDLPAIMARLLSAGAAPLTQCGFWADRLAAFAPAGRVYNEPLTRTPTGDASGVLVQCGPSFLGLIMPVRRGLDAPGDPFADWRDLLPPAAAQEDPR